MITQGKLTELKSQKEYEWLNECGSQSLQMALRELDNSYQRFFKQLGGYPKFKSKKNNHQSFTAPQNIKIENNKTYLPNFTKDGIKTKFHREIPKDAILKQATISRTNNQYFIITPPINNLNYVIILDGKNRRKKIITKRVV